MNLSAGPGTRILEYREIITALRNADAAIDESRAKGLDTSALEKDAKRLAFLADKARPVEMNLGKSFASGVANVVGMPVDVASTIANRNIVNTAKQLSSQSGAPVGEFMPERDGPPVGGSEWLREQTPLTFPVGEEPKDLASRAVREIGSMAVPVGGLALKARYGANAGKGLLDRAARSFAQNPKRMIAGETAAASTAATGGYLAEQETDDPVTIALAELAGGSLPAAAKASGKASVNLARKLPTAGLVVESVAPYTRAGGRVMAEKALRRQSSDPARDAELALGGELLEEALPLLTPARRVGNTRLLGLERTLLKRDPELQDRVAENLSKAEKVTVSAASSLAGDPSRARKLLETRRDYVLGLLEEHAKSAAEDAADAVSRLGDNATPRQIAIAARTKVDNALRGARDQEKELYAAVDLDEPRTIETTKSKYLEEFYKRSDVANPKDIPAYLHSFVNRKKGVTTRHLVDIRGRLLEDAADARAKGQWNKARILSKVSDALLDDLGAKNAEGSAIATAVEFSRKLNEKFTQGAIGDLLGFSSDRGFRVDPSETMEFLDQGRDIGRANHLTALMEASPDSAQDVESYLQSQFMTAATSDGVVNKKAAERFLRKYSEVIDKFPALKENLSQAMKASDRAVHRMSRKEKVGAELRNQRISRASLFLDGTVGEEWRRVLSFPGDRKRVAQDLMRQLRSDPDAVQGGKQGLVDELMRRAKTNRIDDEGERIFNSARLISEIEDNRDVLASVLSESEMYRLGKIANTLNAINRKTGEDIPVFTGVPSKIIDFFAALLGAKSGSAFTSGSGESLVIAGRGSKELRSLMGNMTKNKTYELLGAAVDDPELYSALMAGVDSPEKVSDAVRKLNAWLVIPATLEQGGTKWAYEDKESVE